MFYRTLSQAPTQQHDRNDPEGAFPGQARTGLVRRAQRHPIALLRSPIGDRDGNEIADSNGRPIGTSFDSC